MPLVLLHPLPLDGSAWGDAMRALGDPVAPDLYDFGDDIGDWARAVLDLAGPGPLDLVGNSVGGSCALEIAALAPDRVRGIVLIGAKAGHRPEPECRDEALRILDDEGLDAAFDAYWAPLFGDEVAAERGRAIAHGVGVDGVRRGVVAFHGRPDRHALACALDVPILVVAGEHDINPANTRGVVDQLRRGSFVELDGCGHYAPIEQPDRLADVVAAHLNAG